MMRIEAGFVWFRGQLLRDLDILVSDGKIVDVGRDLKGGKRFDAKKKLVLPGLVNSHTHVASGLVKGLGVGMPLMEMFSKVLFPIEKAVGEKEAYLGSLASLAGFLKTGVTCVSNMGLWGEPVVKAMRKLGFKGSVALANKDQGSRGQPKRPNLFSKNKALVKKLGKDERITGFYGVANELEASEDLISRVVEAAEEDGAGIHVHVAESREETSYVEEKHGKTSLSYFSDLGVLGLRTLAAHCVFPGKDGLKVLAEKGSTVVHCPSSNVFSKNGVAPVPEMLFHRVPVAIGTDDPVSSIQDDLRQEMYAASILQGSRGKSVSPQDLLGMSEAGVSPLGLKTGRIEPGFYADLVFLDVFSERVVPFSLQNALFSAPVSRVLVDGKTVVEDSRIVGFDEEKMISQALRAGEKILENFR